MTIEPKSLQKTLMDIAKAHWQANAQPILLSNLPPLLLSDFPDYKKSLGTNSLKQFILESAESSGYRLVEHPTQAAKIGLLPDAESFEFAASTVTQDIQATQNPRANEKALIEFLRALKTLPAKDIAEVHIPVSVLVGLLKK